MKRAIKVNSDGKRGWQLLGAPKGARLQRVMIKFPEVQSQAGGKTTYHIGGPADVSVRIKYANGESESISGVEIDW